MIVVYRPDVHVGAPRRPGGVDEPNADWTEVGAGPDRRRRASRADKVAGASIVFADEPTGDDGAYLSPNIALFTAVSDSIMVHKLFVGNRPATKKEASLTRRWRRRRADRPDVEEPIGALFLFTHDAWWLVGAAAQIFGAHVRRPWSSFRRGISAMPGWSI